MDHDCIILWCDHEVSRTDTSDTTELSDAVPVFYDTHKTGNSSVHGTFLHLIDDVCLSQSIVKKCSLLVVDHNCYRALTLETIIYPLVGHLAAVHSFTGFLFYGRFFLFRFFCFYFLFRFRDICYSRCCSLFSRISTSCQCSGSQCCAEEKK